ncbi:gamma-glutamylcyclotransferase [Mesorhizobium sp. B2-1-3]|uniref:gamma-glutamylcyclotransferase n=1 Tax=Mesorhizobium sp. B2-1-3 TaxID=2589972 RepID=UPI0032B2F731
MGAVGGLSILATTIGRQRWTEKTPIPVWCCHSYAIRHGDMGDFWVFGYGSLIWRPGFAHVETRRARLHGYRRALCVYFLRASRHAGTSGAGARP